MKHNIVLQNIVLSSLIMLLFQPAAIAVDAGMSSLPEPESARNSAPKQSSESINLKGIISVYDGPTPDQLVGGLINSALEHDQTNKSLQARDKHMHSALQKVLNTAKAGANYAASASGFEMSSEGADVILDEKLKLKSNDATAYVKQKKFDELHAKVFSSLLQIAQGLGVSDPIEREKTISAGMQPLSELVGASDAKAALESLQAWSQQLHVPQEIFEQKHWTVLELQNKSEDLLRSSAQGDPVMRQVRRALHKYNGHSKFALGAAKAINVGLNVAMMSPTLISPVAQIMQFVFQMSTGGSEDSKLLSEIYLDKRLECRWKRLNQEAGQAVNAYNNAVLTKNPVLLGLSESFITGLGGEEAGSRVVGTNKLIARKSTHDDAIDCVQTHGVEM